MLTLLKEIWGFLIEIWNNEGRPRAMSLLDVWRVCLHFPVGVFAGWLIFELPVLGVVFSVGFLTYEIVEDWRIADRGYKDIMGFLVGMAVISIL